MLTQAALLLLLLLRERERKRRIPFLQTPENGDRCAAAAAEDVGGVPAVVMAIPSPPPSHTQLVFLSPPPFGGSLSL